MSFLLTKLISVNFRKLLRTAVSSENLSYSEHGNVAISYRIYFFWTKFFKIEIEIFYIQNSKYKIILLLILVEPNLAQNLGVLMLRHLALVLISMECTNIAKYVHRLQYNVRDLRYKNNTTNTHYRDSF